RELQEAREALEGQRGPVAAVKKLGCVIGSGMTFARLFLLPTIPNTIPDQVRMQPAW
ncbi:MAG: magnesium-protoporphyrin IX monomethyl ester (oxidative) cyclase, partial [Gammaproteobacteria bacterium]|nr:magnesium-protoporphyrin IX monomethyl ester (oxidative) cyclase [Gammaproteobacteria bacterium]